MTNQPRDPESRTPTASPPAGGGSQNTAHPTGSIPSLRDGQLGPGRERDESLSPDRKPDPVIEQAKRDLDAGLVDTDMRATPGLDAGRREQLVPGPGGKSPTQKTLEDTEKKHLPHAASDKI